MRSAYGILKELRSAFVDLKFGLRSHSLILELFSIALSELF